MNNIISILDVQTELVPIQRSKLKGLNADLLLRFDYYFAVFNQQELCIIQPKRNISLTPLKYKYITDQIERNTGMPVVVLMESPAYYERERYISQGVYFIASDRYAFLPSLIANVRVKEKRKKPVKLIPPAQYLLLFYLSENKGHKKFTIRELEKIFPFYNYLAISRAIINLENLQLCKVEKDGIGTKHIYFEYSKAELWEKSQKHVSSPVKKILYSDGMPDGIFRVSGINALSHYSRLNPEPYDTVAIWDRLFSESSVPCNEIEGLYKIEVWKYPTFMPEQSGSKIVDKLSLYLSMKDDPDARIEKELEELIKNMPW
jgi:hypothetical protein